MYKTRQELFTASVIGLRKQGFRQSKNALGQCLYRGQDGTGCAIGVLIPPNVEVPPHLNGHSATSRSMQPVLEAICGKENANDQDFLQFLCDLQYVHDSAKWPTMEDRLRAFALRQELAFPEA